MRIIVSLSVKKLRERLLPVVLVGMLALTPLIGVVSAAEPAEGWMTPGDPVIKFTELPAGAPAPINGNTDCHYTNYDMLIREDRIVQYPGTTPFHQTELHHNASCAVQTPRGVYDGEYLEVGTLAGRFVGSSGPVRIPYSNALLTLQTVTSQSSRAFFYRAVVPDLNEYTGEVDYNVTGQRALSDKAGSQLFIRPGSYGFSGNGRWMVADSTGIGFIRVDLDSQDKMVVPFGAGLGTNPRVAISDDGRYAVVAQGNSTFKIYDLDACAIPVPDKITGPVNCPSKDVLPFLKNNFNGYFGVNGVRFVSSNMLTLTVSYTGTSGEVVRASARMVPNGQTIEDLSYLALGDSFSSGEGAYDYEPGTDTPENKCHLSRKSYPYLVAATLELSDFHSVACSGAKYDPDYAGEPQHRVTFAPEWLAGSKTQQAFVVQAQPEVITVSMIGNDIGFVNKIMRCLVPDSCFHFREDRESIVEEINSKFYALFAMYSNIKKNAKDNARVYVLGYPQLFSVTGDCRFSVNLDKEERRTAEGLVGYLNAVIKAAAEKAGVQYIDVGNAFGGRLLCGDGEEAVNGLVDGDDIGLFGANFIGNESFHPNRLGQQLLASALLEQSGYFTKPMPEPDSTKSVPDTSSQTYRDFVGNAPGGGIVKRIIFVGADSTRSVIAGGTTGVKTSLVMAANAPFQAWFNSDPTYAGTLTTDENGVLQGEIMVPEDLEPGFHTLHLYGKDLAGKDVDLYETVYVAASAEDYDGDGINNQDEKCLATEPIDIDHDLDGIDDACDPEIGEPQVPLDTTPPEVTGMPDRVPDADGWYKDDVTIAWSATDPEPSSGTPTQPDPTTANQEGVRTYTSGESCDPADNCATGSLELRIDKTAPVLGLATWSCTTACSTEGTIITIPVSDALSGVTTAEYFLGDSDPGLGIATPAQIENGTIRVKTKYFPSGTHNITIRAQDRAGNWAPPLQEYVKVYNLLGIKLVTRQQSPAPPPTQTILQKVVTIVKTVVETVLDSLSKLFKW